MFQSLRDSRPRVAVKLDKQALRSAALRQLPQLACQLAALRDSPARLTGDALLRKLLDELTDLLHLHLPPELLRAAQVQLDEICRRSASCGRTFEACVRHLQELTEAKLNLAFLGGATDSPSRRILSSVHAHAAAGGLVKKLAAESLWLSVAIEVSEAGPPVDRDIMTARGPLPPISDDAFERIREQAAAIVRARRELKKDVAHSEPVRPREIRAPARDLVRVPLLKEALDISLLPSKRLGALKRLRRDNHEDVVEALLTLALRSDDLPDVREVATCILEELLSELPNELAGIVGKRLAGWFVNEISAQSAGIGLFLALRLLEQLPGDHAVSLVELMLQDPAMRLSLEGGPHEVAVLLLAVAILGEGHGSVTLLVKFARGEGLDHLPRGPLLAIKTKAVEALASNSDGVGELLKLLLTCAAVDNEDPFAWTLAHALSQTDSHLKVETILAELRRSLERGFPAGTGHARRLIRALKGTSSHQALQLLTQLATSRSLPVSLREECADSLTRASDTHIVEVGRFFEHAQVGERLSVLPALRGAQSEEKLALVGHAFLKPFEPRDGELGIREKLELITALKDWRIL